MTRWFTGLIPITVLLNAGFLGVRRCRPEAAQTRSDPGVKLSPKYPTTVVELSSTPIMPLIESFPVVNFRRRRLVLLAEFNRYEHGADGRYLINRPSMSSASSRGTAVAVINSPTT